MYIYITPIIKVEQAQHAGLQMETELTYNLTCLLLILTSET